MPTPVNGWSRSIRYAESVSDTRPLKPGSSTKCSFVATDDDFGRLVSVETLSRLATRARYVRLTTGVTSRAHTASIAALRHHGRKPATRRPPAATVPINPPRE